MNKLLEGLVGLFNDLKKEGGLSDEQTLDLLRRVKDGKQTDEDDKIFEKISSQ